MREREEKRSGILEAYKKLNKITLPIGVGAGIVGIAIGMPWLVTLGFGSAALDAAQIIAINKVNNKKQQNTGS